MATANAAESSTPQHSSHASHNSEGLKTWWSGFKRRGKKDTIAVPTVQASGGIFGFPLQDSIKYANVAISLMDEDGKSFIYGYVPIVVAKCGVFLKEKATDVEGIFRLNGSAKRIKELQAQFDQPPRYGKGLDWAGYTVHDAANVLRRYLNQLPQPIVPLEAYERFRDPLRDQQTQAVGDTEAQAQNVGDFDHSKAIVTYQQLITQLPPLNRQLLLYVLDLLSVFASKSDVNRMTSANLAAIFQPGLLSHPEHDMKPQEYRLSQDVLIFLIDNQDSFLIGMNGTAADEKTVREVQSGAPTPQPATPTKASQSGLGRSASSASAGNESQRRLGGIRRNLSVSSKNSRNSAANSHAPNTPSSGHFASGSGGGVHRSNTVPSKKSPALSSRFARGLDSPNTPLALSPALASPAARATSPGSKLAPTPSVQEPSNQPTPTSLTPTMERSSMGTSSTQQTLAQDQSKERLIPNENATTPLTSDATLGTPGKPRNLSAFLKSSPTSDSKESRQPNKLKKKRIPSSAQPSASSSTHSLQNGEPSPRNASFFTPMATPGLGIQSDPLTVSQGPPFESKPAAPAMMPAVRPGDGIEGEAKTDTLESSQQHSESTLKPMSPIGSMHSKSSITDLSEQETSGDAGGEVGEKKRRWRFSSTPKKNDQSSQLASPPLIGVNQPAGNSTSSVGSWHKARKSMSQDVPPAPLEPVISSVTQPSDKPSDRSENSASKEKESAEESEKRGLFGRLRNKIHNAKEERKEREAEKERAKSPPRTEDERSNSKHSLSAIASDAGTRPAPPLDATRESRIGNSSRADNSELSSGAVAAAAEPPVLAPIEERALDPTDVTSRVDNTANVESSTKSVGVEEPITQTAATNGLVPDTSATNDRSLT